jgi:hypothetical protein
MTQRIAIPRRYFDVTSTWMTSALQEGGLSTSIQSLKRGAPFGYKKNKFYVDVEYADGASTLARSFVVKGNFPDENDPSTGSAWAMASELRSLRDVAPLVAAPAMPRSHYIGVGDEASVIVMEDLRHGGAVFFDAFHTLDLAQAMAFMDAFARMHASSWNSPAFERGGSMGPESFAGENRRVLTQAYFPTFFEPAKWRSYVELPRGRALPRAFQDLARAEEAWRALWRLLEQSATVVVHGDEHLGNLYVTADGTPGVIDWFARPDYWPVGIAYFMVCALDVIDRRNWERPLLSHYVTRLAAHGAKDVPSLEDAWFFYRCATFYPTITWLNNSAVWQPEAINTANAVRAATAAIDHDVYRLLGMG